MDNNRYQLEVCLLLKDQKGLSFLMLFEVKLKGQR